jgi:hypothetical protein
MPAYLAVHRKSNSVEEDPMEMIAHSSFRFAILCALLIVWVGAVPCRGEAGSSKTQASDGSVPKSYVESSLNGIAESYVKLALAVGEHDSMYVDSYYGPAAWLARAKLKKEPLAAIEKEAALLVAELKKLDVGGEEEMIRLRHGYLKKELESLAARTAMLDGAKCTFDEESRSLYDAVAPHFEERYFKEVLARVDSIVPPGEGSLADRIERFKKSFIVPKDRLDAVFSAAIAEARARTRRHIDLPANETLTIEYVTNKPWSAYNWYKGDNRSVIQVNTDLPTYIDSPLGLACHEGYPGHHVQNVLFEQHLAKERGWVEFTINPLFGPHSLINEGCANFGVETAFPGDERLAFERNVLFPLAGLDPAKVDTYSAIRALLRELSHAKDEAARRYIDGEISAEEAAQFISTYALMTVERARKLVTFIDRYRSYIINYNVGYDLVKEYIERLVAAPDHPEERWMYLNALLSSPRVPSDLK